MKIFALINDGYKIIYHKDYSIVEDWKYIYQENFAILRIFEIDVEEDIIENDNLSINFNFNKKDIPQSEYSSEKEIKNYAIRFENGIGYIDEVNTNKNLLDLTLEEKVIINVTRKHIKNREKHGNY